MWAACPRPPPKAGHRYDTEVGEAAADTYWRGEEVAYLPHSTSHTRYVACPAMRTLCRQAKCRAAPAPPAGLPAARSPQRHYPTRPKVQCANKQSCCSRPHLCRQLVCQRDGRLRLLARHRHNAPATTMIKLMLSEQNCQVGGSGLLARHRQDAPVGGDSAMGRQAS